MEPECVVCLERYDAQDRTPRVLSCGHSVCQRCVTDLRAHWGGAQSAGLVQCPECKQHTKLPATGSRALPKNIELMRLIQAMARPHPDDRGATRPWLLSEFAFGEPAIWVLPEPAVKIHERICCGFRLGELDGDPVVLELLGEVEGGAEYRSRVRAGWNALSGEVRGELARLIAMSPRYLAEIVGLWASQDGPLFLVSKVWIQGIEQARNLFGDGERRSVSARTLLRLGLELCEIFMEIRLAGVRLDAPVMESFVLDRYGHLRLHVGSWALRRPVAGGGSEEVECEVTEKADVHFLGRVLLWVLSEPGILDRHERLKERLKSIPTSTPRVVDLWRELKDVLEDPPLGMSSHSADDLSKEKPELPTREPPAESFRIDPEPAPEARDDDSQDAPTSTPEAPSMSRALIDVGGDVKTLRGHMDTVSCLSVCANYLISASFDKTLRVWSLDGYGLVRVWRGHEQRITAVAVHEASKLCISGDYGGRICAWNVDNAAPVATWQEHQDWRYTGVASLAVSGDEILYSGSGDRTIKAWSTLGFEHVATLEGHKGVVSVLVVEGEILFSGSWDGTVRLWWRPEHSPLACFGGGSSVPLGGIRALVKCPASGLLFSGHDSGAIQVWDEACVGSLKAHTGVVSGLALDKDWLYSSSWDGFVKAWRLEDVLSGASNPVEKKCNQGAVTALCCSPQEKLFLGVKQEIQVYSHEGVI